MSIGSILSWIVCGLIVGGCARLLVPGRQGMSLSLTIVLGIGGALLGGFLYALIRGPSSEPFSLAGRNWYGWVVALLGGMLVVWMYPRLYPRKWWN